MMTTGSQKEAVATGAPGPDARVFVTGLTGQDGYYLAQILASRGCELIAGARASSRAAAEAIAAQFGSFPIHDFDLLDPRSIDAAVSEIQPDIIYHLAAQSSVRISWEDPVGTAEANAMGTLHLLEAIRRNAPTARFVFAASCDCYDHEAATEGVTPRTAFLATNPYAASKIMAHQLVRCWRDRHGLHASVAVLFNHTSPRRSPIYVERGIVRNAVAVALGRAPDVPVGSMEIRRDWSWAEDLMEGFAAMGALAEPAELVLASGRTRVIGDWVREAFAQLGLDLERHGRIDPSRLHPGDRQNTFGNIKEARRLLNWSPRVDLPEMVKRLIEADRAEMTKGSN